MWDASGPAFCRASSIPVSEISMIVTCQPCFASQIVCLPAPPATSKALPPRGNSGRINSENVRTRKGSGAVLAVAQAAASRYLRFQRSRSLSEEEIKESAIGFEHNLDRNFEFDSDLKPDSNVGDFDRRYQSERPACPE